MGNALVLILSLSTQGMAQLLLGEGWETDAQAP